MLGHLRKGEAGYLFRNIELKIEHCHSPVAPALHTLGLCRCSFLCIPQELPLLLLCCKGACLLSWLGCRPFNMPRELGSRITKAPASCHSPWFYDSTLRPAQRGSWGRDKRGGPSCWKHRAPAPCPQLLHTQWQALPWTKVGKPLSEGSAAWTVGFLVGWAVGEREVQRERRNGITINCRSGFLSLSTSDVLD